MTKMLGENRPNVFLIRYITRYKFHLFIVDVQTVQTDNVCEKCVGSVNNGIHKMLQPESISFRTETTFSTLRVFSLFLRKP